MNLILREFLLKLLRDNVGGFTDPRVPEKRFVLPRIKMWRSGHQVQTLRDFCTETQTPLVCFYTLHARFAKHLLRQGITYCTSYESGRTEELRDHREVY